MGWLSDFFRLAWGLLYWNTRKTTYRLRRQHGRARCPCQHPSDSGRAFETGCAAMIHWREPARFQRLCPLLKQTADGPWRCSVDREAVRPFWGRAAAAYGSGLLFLYLTAALGMFVFARGVGYDVTYPGVLWPPAWEKFTGIRADFFLKKYRAALAAGDMQAALMSLSTAYNLAPQNYAAGRQLAQFWQVNQPGLSDRIYRRLLHDHPREAEPTAQVWFRSLLARGDFAGVEKLAAERISAEPGRASAWVSAFLFANRRTHDGAMRGELSAVPALPDSARFLLTLTGDLQTQPASQARARLLRAAVEAGDSLSFYHVCRELIARGFAQDALTWIDRRDELLGKRDVISLRLDALAALSWVTTRRSEVESLLVTSPDPVIIELLCAHLIRYPDETVRALVFERLDRTPLPADKGASYPAYLALFCAAGAGRDRNRLQWSSDRIKELIHGEFRGLDVIGKGLLDGNRSPHIENVLPALQPLSLEVSYALFEHYAPAS